MSDPLATTPHPEIDALLREMLDGARAVLGPHWVGMILFGSLAAGDFDDASDVDVLFVTTEDVTGAEFGALLALHDRLARRDTPWAIQFEVSYIPLAALRRYDPAHNRHPRLDRGSGERLHWMTHAEDWVALRHVIRERGIVVAGPAPASLIDPVSPDDLRAAMRPAGALHLSRPVQTDSCSINSDGDTTWRRGVKMYRYSVGHRHLLKFRMAFQQRRCHQQMQDSYRDTTEARR